jgi:hypothetical protein
VRRRRELERKFEIVLLLENDRMELKSSAKDSYDLRQKAAQFLIAIQAELRVRLPFRDSSMWCPPGIGAKF